MNHKFESTYFKFDSGQLQGPQARCHEQDDKNFHEFFAYAGIPSNERCFFEQIREGQACNEYYDIDRTLEQATNENEIRRLEQQVFAAFLGVRNQHAPEYALDSAHCRVLSASNDKKVSLHIVIPTYAFENNNKHMKSFIQAFSKDLAFEEFYMHNPAALNRLLTTMLSEMFSTM
ncbi:hypothetical protein BGZ73_003444 [Actinomortierella ambigua]|nr:hypothetical protein BGZ73_003444 [Actinomortierella ambigua]